MPGFAPSAVRGIPGGPVCPHGYGWERRRDMGRRSHPPRPVGSGTEERGSVRSPGAAEEQGWALNPQACALRNGRREGRASPLSLCHRC